MENKFAPTQSNLMSDDVRELLKAIRAAKREFGALTQSGKNAHQKYEYAKIDDILDAVEESLLNHDVVIKHNMDVIEGNDRLITTLIHIITGQWSRDIRTVINEKGGNQGRGAGQTYARKDALRALLSLRAKDDDCEEEARYIAQKSNTNHDQNAQNSNYLSDKQVGLLKFKLRETKIDNAESQLLRKFSSLELIPREKFNEVLKWLDPEMEQR